ncbi:unnamed protein product [Sphagnum tenellum]
MQQRAGDSETKTDVAKPSMFPGSDPSRPSSIADVRFTRSFCEAFCEVSVLFLLRCFGFYGGATGKEE